MSWRDKARPARGVSDVELPLETVLEHYGVSQTYRSKQMVSCPMQPDDSTPSMSVDLTKQLFKCHSCGRGGDVWVLIQEMEGEDYRGARRFAEATFGVAGSNAGRGSDDLRSVSRRGRGRGSVANGSRNHKSGGAYAPSWRRR